MRGDAKMVLAGFCAGMVLGAVALTAVGATTSVQLRPHLAPARSAPLAYAGTEPLDMAAPRADDAAKVLEFYDIHGRLVYRSDPAQRLTTVARGTVIPTPTAHERDTEAGAAPLVKAPIVQTVQ